MIKYKQYKFKDTKVFAEYFFSIGIEETTSQPYISVPVSNGMIETEEYYHLDQGIYDSNENSEGLLIALSRKCLDKQNDENLFYYETLNRRDFPKQNEYKFKETKGFNESGYVFSIGIEEQFNKPYISVLVGNGMHKYREYFRLDEDLYNHYDDNKSKLVRIAEKSFCKENEENLLYSPTYIRRKYPI